MPKMILGEIYDHDYTFKGMTLDELEEHLQHFDRQEIDLIEVFMGDEANVISILTDLIYLARQVETRRGDPSDAQI